MAGRQNIKLPADLAERIRKAWAKTHGGSSYGALQAVVVRGAELALTELTGESNIPATGENAHTALAKGKDNPYNSEQIRAALDSLSKAVECIVDAASALSPANPRISNVIPEPTVGSDQRLSDLLDQAEDEIRKFFDVAQEFEESEDYGRKRKRPNAS